MALRKGPNGGVIAWHLWRAIKRWRWPIAALILSILMIYALYWTGPQPYQSYTFGILPILLSYGILIFCILLIFAGILYELNTKFRIYYICEGCNKSFVFEGKKDPDVRCPSCSSKRLSIAEIIPLKEYPRGIVWNPPKGESGTSPEEKGVDRATYVVGELIELCHHLQQIGIMAMVVWDDPHPEATHYQMTRGTYGHIEDPLGRIKVEGKVDAIKLCITSELAWGYGRIDQWPYRPQRQYTLVTYYISYLVNGIVENLEDDLKAETRPIKAGLFEKKVTGFEWKGGRLAEILNSDSVLKNILLRIGSPDIVILPHKETLFTSAADIQLVPKIDMEEASYDIGSHKEGEQYVEIRTSTIVADERTARGQAFPTLEAFEAYERIARHIRSIIAYRP